MESNWDLQVNPEAVSCLGTLKKKLVVGRRLIPLNLKPTLDTELVWGLYFLTMESLGVCVHEH